MQGTQYATKRSILCRGAFCGPTVLLTVRKCLEIICGVYPSKFMSLLNECYHALLIVNDA